MKFVNERNPKIRRDSGERRYPKFVISLPINCWHCLGTKLQNIVVCIVRHIFPLGPTGEKISYLLFEYSEGGQVVCRVAYDGTTPTWCPNEGCLHQRLITLVEFILSLDMVNDIRISCFSLNLAECT